MSLSHLRAALSLKKIDNQNPTVHPQHNPPTACTGALRRTPLAGRSPVQSIGNRRASVRSSMSVRRVSRLPQLGTESSQGTRSIGSSNESGDPLNSGFFCDDDEVERNRPSLFTIRHPEMRRRSSKRQRTSFFTRLASRVKPSNNITAGWRLPQADNTRNSHVNFYSEESPSQCLPSSEGTASPQPNPLTSIIPDPAPSGPFSLHGLGTLLLPPASQPGFKHRNRNTALISQSRTFERYSRAIGESSWEDLGDADHAPDEVKRKARLSAWTTLTSTAALPVALSDVSALSANTQDETRDRPRDLPAELAPSRSESISTASSIEPDAVSSHSNSPFTLVAGQFSTSVWEETQFSAMRSSTDLVHGSFNSGNVLADLIDKLGLDDDRAERRGLSNKAPGESKGTLELTLHPVKNDILFDSQITPAGQPLPPSTTAPKCATMSAYHPPTLDSSLTKPISPHTGSNLSFHPILDIEVKKLSPVTSAPEPAPLYTHPPRDKQVPDPSGPRNKRKSFLPDMSGSTIQGQTRPKKVKRRLTASQPSRPYLDQLPPSLDSLLPGKTGKGQTRIVKPLSRSPNPPPPHWPPVAPSQSRLLNQKTVAGIPPARPNTPNASRIEHRMSKVDRSDWSFGRWFPPPPFLPNKVTH